MFNWSWPLFWRKPKGAAYDGNVYEKKEMITKEHLEEIAGINTPLMEELSIFMTRLFPAYEIDSPREYAHFLAQACHETDRFKTLKEYASGKAYEGRKDLGNTFPGDGTRFRGRGIFQTTGRFNYQNMSTKKGNPYLFVSNPELLEIPENAVWSACEYWKDKSFNDIANLEDDAKVALKRKGTIYYYSPVEYISVRINGGFNGMDERKKFYERAKKVFNII